MFETREYNPDADPQQRTEQIQNTFESQDYELGVREFAETMTRWAREGRQDAALELAQKVEAYRAQVLEAQPELANYFDIKIAEAYLYAGDEENENLTGAEERYQRVAETKLTDIPEAGATLPEAERAKYSEVFHALDRLGDVAFVGGRYQEAGERYADAVQKRAEFVDDPNEQGPLACAKYGQAASAFMQGDTSKCESLLAEATEQLAEVEGGEQTLREHIQRLADANTLLTELDESKRPDMLKKLDDGTRQSGGSGGGVKQLNFESLFAEARAEISMNEE